MSNESYDVENEVVFNVTRERQIEERWGDGLGGGFTLMPSVLLHNADKLFVGANEGLSAEHVVLLLNLISHWWDRDRLPYPRTDTLARRMGISRRTVQRRLLELESAGFIKREPMRNDDAPAITTYDMSGLVAKLKPFGKTARDERESRIARARRKGQSLGV